MNLDQLILDAYNNLRPEDRLVRGKINRRAVWEELMRTFKYTPIAMISMFQGIPSVDIKHSPRDKLDPIFEYIDHVITETLAKPQPIYNYIYRFYDPDTTTLRIRNLPQGMDPIILTLADALNKGLIAINPMERTQPN